MSLSGTSEKSRDIRVTSEKGSKADVMTCKETLATGLEGSGLILANGGGRNHLIRAKPGMRRGG